jgi:hypothetical protein
MALGLFKGAIYRTPQNLPRLAKILQPETSAAGVFDSGRNCVCHLGLRLKMV